MKDFFYENFDKFMLIFISAMIAFSVYGCNKESDKKDQLFFKAESMCVATCANGVKSMNVTQHNITCECKEITK